MQAICRVDGWNSPCRNICQSPAGHRIAIRLAVERLAQQRELDRAEQDQAMFDAVRQLSDDAAAQLPQSASARQIIRAESQTEVWKGLDRLKELDRDTLVAFYIKGRSLKQMSREFETPIGTIKRRLHVARNRLKSALEAHG